MTFVHPYSQLINYLNFFIYGFKRVAANRNRQVGRLDGFSRANIVRDSKCGRA